MEVNKWAVVDSWKEKFDQTGEDIFDIIENAIGVATRYRPASLLEKRGRIGELLFAKFYEDDQSDITEEEEFEAEKESAPIHVASTVVKPKTEFVKEDKIVDAFPKRKIIKINLKHNVAPKLVLQDDNIEKKEEMKRNCQVISNRKESVASTPKLNLLENKLGFTRTKKIVAEGKPKDDETSQELKFLATKRRLEEKYKKIESLRKRIRMIELKDLPPQRIGNRCKKSVVRNFRGNFKRC